MDDSNVVPAQFVSYRDNDADIVFNGSLLASIDNKEQAEITGRWIELSLYRTDGGKLVCERARRTLNVGERDKYESAICSSVVEVTAFLGFGRMSKNLFTKAGLDVTVFIP